MRLPSFLVSAAALLTAASAFEFDVFDPTLDLEYDESTELMVRQIPHHCSSGVHVIGASGFGAQNIGTLSLLGSLADKIVKAIPGSTRVDLPYPKGSPDAVTATQVGAKNLRRYLREYHKACKDTKIVTIGYSAGAIITMNALCGASEVPWQSPAKALPAFWNKHIIATVVYGDQTRQAGQSYDRGTCHAVGRFPRTKPAACKPFEAGMRSYCDIKDPECCLGDDPNAHFQYPERYDHAATEFVVKRFREVKAREHKHDMHHKQHMHHDKHHKKHHGKHHKKHHNKHHDKHHKKHHHHMHPNDD